MYIGRVYLDKRKYAQAFDEFSKALKINPAAEDAHDGLGHLYLQKRQYDLARASFKKALEVNSDNSSSRQGLGTIYLEEGHYELAQAELEKAVQFSADNVYIHRMLGYIYKRQGSHDLAVEEFIKSTNLRLVQLAQGASRKDEKLDAAYAEKEKFPVKILRMPNFYDKRQIHFTELNTSLLPPLALGQITSYLRMHGITAEQDDLNIKIHHDNYYAKESEKEIDVSVFFDEARVLKYASGTHDVDIEAIMEKAGSKTRLSGYSAILLSLPIIFDNPSGFLFTLALCRFIKNKYNTTIILGGGNQSVELIARYDCHDIDFIIFGEGEIILLELLHALRNEASLQDFFDCHVKENSKLIATEVHPPLKPDFSGLPMDYYRYNESYSDYHGKHSRILEEFNTSGTLLLIFKFIKGCPNECIFCPESTNKIIYVREPKTVALHLKELQEEYHPTGFFFLSDTINLSKNYISEVCEEIIKNKVKILWTDSARAENLTRDVIFKMREAGCIRLILGMETASLRLLKSIDKRIGLKGLENILRWLDEAGIWTGLEIICGLPHENDEDIEETVRFLEGNRGYINTIYFNQFGLRDGSVLLKNAEKFGIKNIVEVNQYADEKFTYFHKYGYDEVNGLRWPDKKKQILASQERLMGVAKNDTIFPIYEFEHFLFFLYNKFSEKKQISSIMSDVAKEKHSLLQKIIDDARIRN